MTRFERELSGELGAFWQKQAEKELEEIRQELADGEITIDSNGVARNCVDRVLMSDMAEKVAYIDSRISLEATAQARDEEVSREIAEYKRQMKNHKRTAEEIAEMRAAFGAGTTIVDVLTGETIQL